MQDSKLNTLTIPIIGSANPSTLCYATAVPMRIVVRNVGGAVIFVAHDSNTLQNDVAAAAGTFRIPPGSSEVFVLAPKQGLFAAASGAGGQVSIAVSEAIANHTMGA